jgi:cell division protein FtsL
MSAKSFYKPNQLSFFSWERFFVLFLLVIICSFIVLIIQVQHKIRHLETRYSKTLIQRVNINEEKGKLLLEKYHLTSLARVEGIAKDKLKMNRIYKQLNNVQVIYIDKLKELNNDF